MELLLFEAMVNWECHQLQLLEALSPIPIIIFWNYYQKALPSIQLQLIELSIKIINKNIIIETTINEATIN